MKSIFLSTLLLLTLEASPEIQAAGEIPKPLLEWQDWATWDAKDKNNPPVYNQPKKRPGLWPSQLALDITPTSGSFTLRVTTYQQAHVILPGNRDLWPQNVTINGSPATVTETGDKPSILLEKAFTGTITGSFRWSEPPQRFQIPVETGILQLTVNGKPNSTATWDSHGTLWLKNRKSESQEKDFISVQVYRLIRDGIPMWLDTEIEVTVSGKSREETIGHILPVGWKLSSLSSSLPVAIDDTGLLKTQVRAGKWTIRATAFHLTNANRIYYTSDSQLPVTNELIAFQSKPDFRLAEVTGIPALDVSQTTFPQHWHTFPVFRWKNTSPFQIEERMRGMGIQKPEGLKINRELWLDQDTNAITFRDKIEGQMQEIWRLDVSPGRELGSVRVDGKGQLVTLNPETEAKGVELRNRNLNLQATGRMHGDHQLSATGWQTNADSVHVKMNLPPGWRLFAVFGADWVHGDWLTAWTLLDLFLLLVFSIAVAKLWHLPAGILAFFAFALAYHEPDAPRYLWFFLLAPLALQNVLKTGFFRHLVVTVKYVLLTLLVLCLIPFIGKQLQNALYPQLEQSSPHVQVLLESQVEQELVPESVTEVQSPSSERLGSWKGSSRKSGRSAESSKLFRTEQAISNLLYDSKARIQTGPGIPEWNWNTVTFGWNGPVTAEQKVHPILIPLWLQRILILLRVGLLIALAATLIKGRIPQLKMPSLNKTAVSLFLPILFLFTISNSSQAEFPDKETLKTLRERLLETSVAFPKAAEIPTASISLRNQKVIITSEIHTAATCTVPLPGKISSWSPISVTVNGRSQPTLRRDDGYLWIALPAGVHQVRLEGLLAPGTEWEWTFKLRPRQVTIDAPGWNYTGVKPNFIPESQIFFTRQQKTSAGEASYDHHETEAVVLINRQLETGLVWKLNTRVQRLSSKGKAISIRIPILPGEKVLSSHIIVKDGYAEIRIGAQNSGISWQSELPTTPELELTTTENDRWIEQWRLTNSPVWNIHLSGLTPVFEVGKNELTPVWYPWPGESVRLSFSRPQAVEGETTTINSVWHQISLGARERSCTLTFKAECSLGQDFPLTLPEGAEITSVHFNGNHVPARMDSNRLMIALKPGSQTIEVKWTENNALGFVSIADAVQFPVEVTNVRTQMTIPDNRWVLWAQGPLQGPAVRFWSILTCSLLVAWILGSIPGSPLKTFEWLLLAIGLTQIHAVGAVIIASWFFLIAWRGNHPKNSWPAISFNGLQLGLVICTVAMIALFIGVISKGLLGEPDMFIIGNHSHLHQLKWYQPSTEGLLPQALCITVSIWVYRLLMLLWALWLAFSLIHWMKWGWQQFSTGGYLKNLKKKESPAPAVNIPPLPKK